MIKTETKNEAVKAEIDYPLLMTNPAIQDEVVLMNSSEFGMIVSGRRVGQTVSSSGEYKGELAGKMVPYVGVVTLRGVK